MTTSRPPQPVDPWAGEEETTFLTAATISPLTAPERRSPTEPHSGAGTRLLPAPGGSSTVGVRGEPGPPPRRRRRRLLWTAVFVAVIGVCAGGVLAATDDVRAQYPAQLASVGPKLAGLRVAREGEPGRAEVVAAARDEFAAGAAADDSVVELLRDPYDDGRPVVFVAGTMFVADPEKTLDTEMRRAGARLTGARSYDPGALGGVLGCADARGDSGEPLVLCAWIDHGSVGLGLFLGDRPMDDCAALLTRIRAEVLVRPGRA